MENWRKYEKTYFMPPEPCYDWVKKDSIDKAPIWCSVDLRDGNQFSCCFLTLVYISTGQS